MRRQIIWIAVLLVAASSVATEIDAQDMPGSYHNTSLSTVTVRD